MLGPLPRRQERADHGNRRVQRSARRQLRQLERLALDLGPLAVRLDEREQLGLSAERLTVAEVREPLADGEQFDLAALHVAEDGGRAVRVLRRAEPDQIGGAGEVEEGHGLGRALPTLRLLRRRGPLEAEEVVGRDGLVRRVSDGDSERALGPAVADDDLADVAGRDRDAVRLHRFSEGVLGDLVFREVNLEWVCHPAVLSPRAIRVNDSLSTEAVACSSVIAQCEYSPYVVSV